MTTLLIVFCGREKKTLFNLSTLCGGRKASPFKKLTAPLLPVALEHVPGLCN